MKYFRFLNITSIDVAVGAAIGTLFFARVFGVTILPLELIVLTLTVWTIYTIDHLLDASRLIQKASTFRHQYHQRNFQVLFQSVLFVGVVDVVLVFFLRSSLLTSGIILAVFVAAYFLLLKQLRVFKEVAGALLYTSGILLLPLSKLNMFPTQDKLIPVLQFGGIVFINLLLFSWFDEEVDKRDEHPSFTVCFGGATTRKLLTILLLTELSIAILYMVVGTIYFIELNIILFIMTGILFFILLNRKYFEENERYRLLGDAVFLLPGFYLLIV